MFKVGDEFIDTVDKSYIKIKKVFKEKNIDRVKYQIIVNEDVIKYVNGSYLSRYCRRLK